MFSEDDYPRIKHTFDTGTIEDINSLGSDAIDYLTSLLSDSRSLAVEKASGAAECLFRYYFLLNDFDKIYALLTNNNFLVKLKVSQLLAQNYFNRKNYGGITSLLNNKDSDVRSGPIICMTYENVEKFIQPLEAICYASKPDSLHDSDVLHFLAQAYLKTNDLNGFRKLLTIKDIDRLFHVFVGLRLAVRDYNANIELFMKDMIKFADNKDKRIRSEIMDLLFDAASKGQSTQSIISDLANLLSSSYSSTVLCAADCLLFAAANRQDITKAIPHLLTALTTKDITRSGWAGKHQTIGTILGHYYIDRDDPVGLEELLKYSEGAISGAETVLNKASSEPHYVSPEEYRAWKDRFGEFYKNHHDQMGNPLNDLLELRSKFMYVLTGSVEYRYADQKDRIAKEMEKYRKK